MVPAGNWGKGFHSNPFELTTHPERTVPRSLRTTTKPPSAVCPVDSSASPLSLRPDETFQPAIPLALCTAKRRTVAPLPTLTSAAIPDAVSGWDARWVVLQPLRLPTGKVVTPFAADTFTMVVKGGSTTPVTVNLNSTTLVYQIDLAGAIYTVAPVDPTAGAATIAANLGAGSPVVVYGIPQQNGTIMASVLYYTTTAAL